MKRALVVGSVLALLFVHSAASNTPNPTSVTVAGSLQSELGCASDWDPACTTTHLTYDANDDVWEGTWSVPTGSWEYKAALNNSWDENYGLHAQAGGANIPLNLAAGTAVKFYYDHKSHWITDNQSSIIATAAGSFQSELGCPADWQAECLRSWLEDPSGSGTYSFSTTALPAGDYEAKAAIDESWDENYGQGGVANGPNITFTVPSNNARVDFTYNPVSHVLTISVVPTADLAVTMAAAPKPVPVGKLVTFTIAVQNNGPDSTQATLTNQLPTASQFIGYTTSSGACTVPQVGKTGTMTCALGSLASAQTAVVRATVKPTVKKGSSISDTASVAGSTLDPVSSNNTATVTVSVK